MPSGAKKRKAAKKKKGNRSNNHSHTSSASSTHGNEDVKHQNHKEIDVGEVSSPGSEDNHNHHDFSTQEIDKERNFPGLEGSRTEKSVLGSEKEISIEDVSYGEHGRFKHDKSVRKSYDGISSDSSGSSGSDNESRDIEDNNQAKAQVEEADDSVSENTPAADSKKILVLGEDTSSPADISAAPYVDGSVIEENGESKRRSVIKENKVGTSVALVDAVLEEERIVQSVEKTEIASGSKECLMQQNDDRWASPQNAHNENNSGVNQPLLVPNPVQKTSWKSCCGLFEMFTGSRS